MTRAEAERELRRVRAEVNMSINSANVRIDQAGQLAYQKVLISSEEYELQADDFFARAHGFQGEAKAELYRVAAQTLRDFGAELLTILRERERIPQI